MAAIEDLISIAVIFVCRIVSVGVKNCAQMSADLDMRMQTIRNEISREDETKTASKAQRFPMLRLENLLPDKENRKPIH